MSRDTAQDGDVAMEGPAASPPPPKAHAEPRPPKAAGTPETDWPCGLCKELTEQMPDPVDANVTMRVGLRDKKKFIDWYCQAVHNAKHKDKNLRTLTSLVEGDVELHQSLVRMRDKAIEILRENPNARITAGKLQDAVAVRETNVDRDKRHGKLMSVRKFKRKYPDKKVEDEIIVKKQKRNGDVVLCVKMYNYSDSEWSFSEADEVAVDRVRQVENGSMMLDADQAGHAQAIACSSVLRGSDGLVMKAPTTLPGPSCSPPAARSTATSSRAGTTKSEMKAEAKSESSDAEQTPFAAMCAITSQKDDGEKLEESQPRVKGRKRKQLTPKRKAAKTPTPKKRGGAGKTSRSSAAAACAGEERTASSLNKAAQEQVAKSKELIALFSGSQDAGDFDVNDAVDVTKLLKKYSGTLSKGGNAALASIAEKAESNLMAIINVVREHGRLIENLAKEGNNWRSYHAEMLVVLNKLPVPMWVRKIQFVMSTIGRFRAADADTVAVVIQSMCSTETVTALSGEGVEPKDDDVVEVQTTLFAYFVRMGMPNSVTYENAVGMLKNIVDSVDVEGLGFEAAPLEFIKELRMLMEAAGGDASSAKEVVELLADVVRRKDKMPWMLVNGLNMVKKLMGNARQVAESQARTAFTQAQVDTSIATVKVELAVEEIFSYAHKTVASWTAASATKSSGGYSQHGVTLLKTAAERWVKTVESTTAKHGPILTKIGEDTKIVQEHAEETTKAATELAKLLKVYESSFKLGEVKKSLKDDDLLEKVWPTMEADVSGCRVQMAMYNCVAACGKLGNLDQFEKACTACHELDSVVEDVGGVTLTDSGTEFLNDVVKPQRAGWIKSLLTTTADEYLEPAVDRFKNSLVETPGDAFLPTVTDEGVEKFDEIFLPSLYSITPVKFSALEFLYILLNKKIEHVTSRGLDVLNRSRKLAATYLLAYKRAPDAAILPAAQCAWEAPLLKTISQGLAVADDAAAWLKSGCTDAPELSNDEEYQKLVMKMSGIENFWQDVLGEWSKRHAVFQKTKVAEVQQSTPEMFRDMLERWEEEELKGPKFLKHPRRALLPASIQDLEDFNTNVESFASLLGSAHGSVYMPAGHGSAKEHVQESKICLGSMHIAMTILKDIPKADGSKNKGALKRECKSRVTAQVPATSIPSDMWSRLTAA